MIFSSKFTLPSGIELTLTLPQKLKFKPVQTVQAHNVNYKDGRVLVSLSHKVCCQSYYYTFLFMVANVPNFVIVLRICTGTFAWKYTWMLFAFQLPSRKSKRALTVYSRLFRWCLDGLARWSLSALYSSGFHAWMPFLSFLYRVVSGFCVENPGE